MGLKEFKEKLLNDEAFAQKFASVKTPEDIVEIASKEGFTFTVEDLKNNTELTDTELEAAAGGKAVMASGWLATDSCIMAKGRFVTW